MRACIGATSTQGVKRVRGSAGARPPSGAMGWRGAGQSKFRGGRTGKRDRREQGYSVLCRDWCGDRGAVREWGSDQRMGSNQGSELEDAVSEGGGVVHRVQQARAAGDVEGAGVLAHKRVPPGPVRFKRLGGRGVAQLRGGRVWGGIVASAAAEAGRHWGEGAREAGGQPPTVPRPRPRPGPRTFIFWPASSVGSWLI